MRPPAFLLSMALAALGTAACSPAGRQTPDENGLLLSAEEVVSRPPALELPGPVKAWAAERAPDLAVYYVRSEGGALGPFKSAKASLRLVLLQGKADIRSGAVRKSCGPGAYVVVPAGTEWEFSRTGKEAALFSILVSPDAVPLQALLGAERS